MDYEAARSALVSSLKGSIKDEQVIKAMLRVPRELFVPPEEKHHAYDDRPLPIGMGQTISQPYIVALMTEALELTGREKVLEIGTGSGYQTAILAELAGFVVTVERIPELARVAGDRLSALGYKNIVVQIAEPNIGWQAEAPYDAIIVTAAAPFVPEKLLNQLAVGGRMIIPVGSRYEQDLYKVIKHKDKNEIQNLGGCRFVSLIGEDAWDEE
ncbi:MAG: protein-L-isoaspartate(D-aspartate) O-methyltransferase [Dehalococcoidales bacterium]|jgi:protein-L-isoaspartate(D-aspartate) O-methyltransferase|nr:protein-L-isoaspartate(D-aspartate) O-methyltransferase [Dehalococcoidales bacterium]NLT28068.1 protein-L-isoaspartate(D-aspartate) O-methyltransferase [Dehalococcoidales bacterium]